MPRVNLIPPEEQAREFRRRIYIFPVAGAVLLLAALGGSYLYYSNELSTTQSQLQGVDSQIASQSKQMAELQSYDDIKNQKQARLTSVTGLYDERVRWSRILDDIAFVIPDNIWLNNITGQVPGGKTGAGPSSQSASGSSQDLVIEGFTYHNEMPTVAIFMVRLGLLPSLKDVTLISAATEKVNDKLVIRFKIAATLKQPVSTGAPATAPVTGEQGPAPVTTTGTSTTPTGTGTTGAVRTTTGTSTGALTTPGGGVNP